MSFPYWDTSCIIKLLRGETGSIFLESQIDPNAPVLISNFGFLEFESVLYRQLRKGLITLSLLEKLEDQLLQYLDLKAILVINLESQIIDQAIDIVRLYGEKRECQTYDALHLGLALELQKRRELSAFVSAYKTLLKLAQDQGLPTIDPETA